MTLAVLLFVAALAVIASERVDRTKVALIGGTLLFVIAPWLHPVPVGIWRWLG